MFGKFHLSFEFKSMGWAFFIPFLPFTILGIQLLNYNNEAVSIYLTLEFLVAPLGCWWLVFLFHEYFEGGLDELLPSYPLLKSYHGLLRGGIIMTIYFSLMLLFILFTSIVITDSTFGPMALKYISLSFLFCSVGFLLVMCLRSVTISLSIIAIYTVTEFMTRGDVIPWHHLFTFNIEPPTYADSVSDAIIHVIFGVIFLCVGQLILNKRFNLK